MKISELRKIIKEEIIKEGQSEMTVRELFIELNDKLYNAVAAISEYYPENKKLYGEIKSIYRNINSLMNKYKNDNIKIWVNENKLNESKQGALLNDVNNLIDYLETYSMRIKNYDKHIKNLQDLEKDILRGKW